MASSWGHQGPASRRVRAIVPAHTDVPSSVPTGSRSSLRFCFWGCLFRLSGSRARCRKSMGGFPCMRVVAGLDSPPRSCASFHGIKLQSLSDSLSPVEQQTMVLCVKWHKITKNNICCIRRVSVGSKPCNGAPGVAPLGGPMWPPAFPPAQGRCHARNGLALPPPSAPWLCRENWKENQERGTLLLKRLSSKDTGEGGS